MVAFPKILSKLLTGAGDLLDGLKYNSLKAAAKTISKFGRRYIQMKKYADVAKKVLLFVLMQIGILIIRYAFDYIMNQLGRL